MLYPSNLLIFLIPLGIFTFFLSSAFTRSMIIFNIPAIPENRSSHEVITPSAGGIGFIGAFLVSIIIYVFIYNLEFNSYLISYGISVLALGIVSLWDDFKPLPYRIRLIMQALSIASLIYANLIIDFPLIRDKNIDFITIFTLISLMGFINATNFIDGLNGLLSGCFLICLIFCFLILPSGTCFLANFYFLLFMALLGFFVFNFPQAKIFMGDVGSTFLGLTLGFSALMAQKYYPYEYTSTALVNKGFVFSLSPLSFLWFDVFSTILRRAFKKERLTEAHRDHMFHILNDYGLSHFSVSCIYFSLTLIAGILTFFTHYGYISFIMAFSIYTVLQIGFCFIVFNLKTHRKF